MSKLDFEQRHRLETEVLPAVIDDPEYAAATIVRLEAERDRLREALRKVNRNAYSAHIIARAALEQQP